MASNDVTQPMTETRDGRGNISPVSDPAPANREHTPAPTASSHPRGPTDAISPVLPTRPTANATVQTPPSAHHQPLPQPYQQYPSPYGPYPCVYMPRRQPPPYSKPWTVTKLILTIAVTLVSIVILALACVFIGERGDGEVTAWYGLPIVIASILWNGAELITYAVRSRGDVKRGIHPGAHVGLHLVFWLVGVFAVLGTATVALSTQRMARFCDDEAGRPYTRWSYCDGYSSFYYMQNMYIPTLRAMTAMFCLWTLGHFVLFVFACIDTHRRNLAKPAGVVVAPPPPPGAVFYPYPPMPMAPPQAQLAQPNAAGTPKGPETSAPPQQNYQNLAGFYAPLGSARAAPTS
ncbi:hypothetical protein GGS23DRAFT_46322 [Durotheca rogersii]|uniref:uncharacterized protein n=1 Tax=Durotheca rogersii TaxID=419775 RepID=UPI0022209E52|nr:uncharacterized protein GGS23DRAFT_46322 [Durotheca rogersii]KAI5868702.1 hypothetical protein GGS23DRAFT_46322 [Durotheca rogersii]